jgi:flagellar biosynthesis chaperone FliJ
MTTFKFRLERVMRWRQSKLEVEQFTLSRLSVERARWDHVLAELETSRAHADRLVLSSVSVHGRDLQAMVRYKELIGKQEQMALTRRAECDRKIEQQRDRLMQARREFRLLEKLRHLRRTEWEAAVDREFEALAAESYLALWNARPRPDPAVPLQGRPTNF